MWYEICRSHRHRADKTGVFCTGSKNFDPQSLDKHGRSKEHMNMAQATANEQASQAEKLHLLLDKTS